MLHRKWGQLKSGLHVPSFLKVQNKEPGRRPKRCRSWRARSRLGGWTPCPNCCGGEEECPRCSSGAPSTVQVVISGITHPTGDCCTDFNDTYIATWAGVSIGEACCLWRYLFPEPICRSMIHLNVSICWHIWSANNFTLSVSIWSGLQDFATWRDSSYGSDVDDPPDCQAFSSESLTWVSGEDGTCDGSSATCLVTAL